MSKVFPFLCAPVCISGAWRLAGISPSRSRSPWVAALPSAPLYSSCTCTQPKNNHILVLNLKNNHVIVINLKNNYCNQCWAFGSACFSASRIRIHKSEVWIRIRLWILPFSHKGVELTEIMLAN